MQEAMLLEQFMLGTYSGVPVLPPEDKESSSLSFRIISVVVCCVAIVGACFYAGYFPTVL